MATVIKVIFYFLVFVFGLSKLLKININLDTTELFRKKDAATQVLEMQNLHDEVLSHKGSVAAKQMLFNRLFGFLPEENELEYLVRKDNINLLSRMKRARSVLEFDDAGPTYRLKARFSIGLLFYYGVSDALFWLISGMLVGFLLVLAFALYIHNTIFTYSILALLIEMVVGLILFAPIRRDWEAAMDVVDKYLPNITRHHRWLGVFRKKILSGLSGVLVPVGIFLAIIIAFKIANPHNDTAKIMPVTQAKIVQSYKPQTVLPVIRHENQRALVAPTVSQGPRMPAYPTKAPVSATLSAR